MTVKSHIADLSAAAERLGWSVERPNPKTLLMHAPKPFDSVSIKINLASLPREDVLRSYVRKIWRYGDPVMKASFVGESDPEDLQSLANIARRNPGPPMARYDPPTPRERRPLPDAAPEGSAAAASPPPAPAQPQVAPMPAAPTPDAATEPPAASGSPRVVLTQPWLAHLTAAAGGGRRYPSGAVLERTWSDGHIDYVCALEGCDWSHERPGSVARHYGRSADHPRASDRTQQQRSVFDPNYTEPLTTGRVSHRVSRWAQRLLRAMEGLKLTGDNEQDAWLLAQRLVELLPDAGSAGEPVELTADELIDKIRELVDRGEYLKLRDDLTSACQRVSALEAEIAAERLRATRAVETMQALRELLNEIPAGEQQPEPATSSA